MLLYENIDIIIIVDVLLLLLLLQLLVRQLVLQLVLLLEVVRKDRVSVWLEINVLEVLAHPFCC